jgi:hypothetical protein
VTRILYVSSVVILGYVSFDLAEWLFDLSNADEIKLAMLLCGYLLFGVVSTAIMTINQIKQ